MDKKDIIDFALENPYCYLATVDGDKPKVRAFKMWHADDTGFYFDTADYKDTFKQLQKNPKMEACFCDVKGKKMLRVSGEAEFTDDSDLRKKLFGDKPDNPKTVIFRLSTGKALYWWRDESGKSHKEEIGF
jgi:uncharacterized pyridoxamine 5'-phosphate oxidase family protein